MPDDSGAIWDTGMGKNGALIGRLNPQPKRGVRTATYWDLPIEFLTREGIWVESTGKAVWFTPINANVGLTGPFLGRLEPVSGMLTSWSFPGRRPLNAGVVGDRKANPRNIWFTYDQWGPSSRVFRYQVSKKIFFEYPPQFAAPRKIVVDDTQSTWFSDWTGKIGRIQSGADCGKIELTERSITWPAVEMDVNSRKKRVEPELSTSAPVDQTVNAVVDGCFVNFPTPNAGAVPNGIAITLAGAGQPNLYLTEAHNTIARLLP